MKKINQCPKPWDWKHEKPAQPLSKWSRAPASIGFYELGFMIDGKFEEMYCGRAIGVTLRQRLQTHFEKSHNRLVRENALALHYRCKTFPSRESASFVEAVHIAALDYPWNLRNEWRQHWALEQ